MEAHAPRLELEVAILASVHQPIQALLVLILIHVIITHAKMEQPASLVEVEEATYAFAHPDTQE